MSALSYRPAPGRPRRSTQADTLISQAMLDEGLRALIKQLRLDRSFDVPYLAGSSKDGSTVYIDRHMPTHLRQGRSRIPIAPFIMLHEAVEKLLFDRFALTYSHAHQFALRLEQVAVRNAGISWHDYNALTQKYVKEVHDERLERLPPDLEIKPYKDEDDVALLKRMQRAGRRI